MKSANILTLLMCLSTPFSYVFAQNTTQFLGLESDHLYTGRNDNDQVCQVWTYPNRYLGVTFDKALPLHPHDSDYVSMRTFEFETQWKKSHFSEKYTHRYEKHSIELEANQLIVSSKKNGSCTIDLDQPAASLRNIQFSDDKTISSDGVKYTSATTDYFEFTKVPVSVQPGQEFEFEFTTKLSPEKLENMAAVAFRLINSKGKDALSYSDSKTARDEIKLRITHKWQSGQMSLGGDFRKDLKPTVTRLQDGNFRLKLKGRVPNFDSNGLGTWKLEVGALNFPNYNDFYFKPFTDDQGDVIERGTISFQVKKK